MEVDCRWAKYSATLLNFSLGVARCELEEVVLSGAMFVFVNRKRTLMKIVFWDRTG